MNWESKKVLESVKRTVLCRMDEDKRTFTSGQVVRFSKESSPFDEI